MKQKNKNSRRFLRNKRSFIFLSILSIGIGFAYLSSNLTITGNTSVSGNSWNIYFTNVQVTDGSVEATVVPTTSGTNTTSIDYTVTLDKPGDFYEFTVDAVNNGTIDAMIQSINMTNLDTDEAKYLSYTATYLDGTELAQNDVLEADDSNTYKVRVEFKKNISADDLSEEGVSLTLTFGVDYVQSMIKTKQFLKLIKDSALTDSNINFTQVSSASNGRGLYVMESTKNDTHPIYYYRGNVSNNNAKFAGFCWKIVRTTETGGTKLIYNGIPDENGQCTNKTGTSTQLASTWRFNSNNSLPSSNGYMYGSTSVYNQSRIYDSSQTYGSSFTYKDGRYTLNNPRAGVDSTHHYTCFTDCRNLKYVYYLDNYGNIQSINSPTGYVQSIDELFNDMFTNTASSNVKKVVDNWFNNTFKNYFTTNEKIIMIIWKTLYGVMIEVLLIMVDGILMEGV